MSATILDVKSAAVFQDTYANREEQANAFLDESLKAALSEDDMLKVESIITTYTSDLIDIYFSMGIKTGARLMHQMLDNSDKDY